MLQRLLLLICVFAFACGGGDDFAPPSSGGVDAGPSADAPPPLQCDPPDMMLVLDRTGSMSQRPDGSMPTNSLVGAEQTKWHQAVVALESLTAQFSDSLRFGLALFPLDPDGAEGTDCSNLDTWLAEYLPPETNDPACQPGEVLVSPGRDAATQIADVLSTDGVGLCSTTPIGAGLAAARDELARVADADRSQHILLITDGADNCDSRAGYTTLSLSVADELAQRDVSVFVVGFDGSGEGIDVGQLNDLACAGGTAPDPGQNCRPSAGGARAIANPSPSRLFLTATDAASLDQSLSAIASEVCCGCVL